MPLSVRDTVHRDLKSNSGIPCFLHPLIYPHAEWEAPVTGTPCRSHFDAAHSSSFLDSVFARLGINLHAGYQVGWMGRDMILLTTTLSLPHSSWCSECRPHLPLYACCTTWLVQPPWIASKPSSLTQLHMPLIAPSDERGAIFSRRIRSGTRCYHIERLGVWAF